MTAFEYKVIPSPVRGEKARGVKGPEARFAHALETVMNDMAAEGWEFQRAETLPSEERSGLIGSVTQWRNLLVFRRPRASDLSSHAPKLLDAPVPSETAPQAPRPVPRSAGLGVAGMRLATPSDSAETAPDQTSDAPETDTKPADTISVPAVAASTAPKQNSFARPPRLPGSGIEIGEAMSALRSTLRTGAARVMLPPSEES